MKAFQTKCRKISGSDYSEVYPVVWKEYKKIRAFSKRRTYIRSAYFKKDKIFLDLFWQHLQEKNWKERLRRMRYFSCAIELIRSNMFEPVSKENPNKKEEILHRFAGITKDKDIFFVQIKENKRTSQKFLISIFPEQ